MPLKSEAIIVIFEFHKVVEKRVSGRWDERGERPFLWLLASFPDRHTYSVHSVQYSCFEQFC